jgi:hypothetical protein
MRIALVAVSTLALIGCEEKKKEAPAAAPAAAEAPAAAAPAPAAAAPAAAGPKCPDGTTANADPAYCIKLPKGFTAKEAKKIGVHSGEVDYTDPDGLATLHMFWTNNPVADMNKAAEDEIKFNGKGKLTSSGTTAGAGKWFEGTQGDNSHQIAIWDAKNGMGLKCSLDYYTPKAPIKEAMDVCKTIVVP